MPRNNTLVDGNSGFSGGLDSTRGSEDLGKDQYAKGINVFISDIGDNIETRDGIHCQEIEFENNQKEEYFKNGNIQGEGWYWNGYDIILLVSVSGCIYSLEKCNKGKYKAKALNFYDLNNPNRTKCWIVRVPNGAIINDGESYPIIVNSDGFLRLNGSYNIGIGRMGAYVQNRFFYVKDTEREIIASDYLDPTRIKNAYNTNIFGFYSPEDEDPITAIGRIQSISKDSKGGSLAFSTNNNLYSCDVRGDRQNWGFDGVGVVELSLPDFGAVSSYSFAPHNTNLWFRNKDLGIVSLRSAYSQFVSNDSVLNQSPDVYNWLSRDSDEFLEYVYTRSYKNRLFTTTGAFLNSDGFVNFKGIISLKPNQLITPLDIAPRRYETLITGITPVALTSIRYRGQESEFFIWSKDKAGNNLYKLMDNVKYDVNNKLKRIEIESSIDTRSYVGIGASDIDLKKQTQMQLAFANLGKKAKLFLAYRDNKDEAFRIFDSKDFEIEDNSFLSDNKIRDLAVSSSFDSEAEFFSRQFKLIWKGKLGFDSIRLIMEVANPNFESSMDRESGSNEISRISDYGYNINSIVDFNQFENFDKKLTNERY